jgi:hypothetical protein
LSTLTPDDFTDEEREAINFRLNIIDEDIAQLEGAKPDPATKYDGVAKFDEANRRVQNASIAELITYLHGILVDRDADVGLAEFVPHYVVFESDFPARELGAPLADLYSTTDLNLYLAAIDAYEPPVGSDTLAATAWTFWREKSPSNPPPGQEVDPDQPPGLSAVEAEFTFRNGERLDSDIGSYVNKQFILNQITSADATIALLQQRKAFWEGLGFPDE